MTIPLSVSKSKAIYCIFALFAIVVIALFAAQREVEFDVEVYYRFYRSLIDNGLIDILSCQSFEPAFCTGSFVFAKLTGSEEAVHYIWTCLFYLVTLRAFLLLWPEFVGENKYSPVSFVTFLFIALNFLDPQAVYFLTRQYVASSFIMLGIAHSVRGKTPIIAFLIATLIYFGALPIATLIYLSTRARFDYRFMILSGVAALFFVYLWTSSLFQFYLSSVQYKLGEYQGINDGDVTISQEIRLVLYWVTALYMFRLAGVKLQLAYVLVYAFYLLTFQNDLFHLRYFKYLEAMSWPSAFFLFFVVRHATGHLVISALALRIYRYITLLTPESAVYYMAKISLLSFLSLFL